MSEKEIKFTKRQIMQSEKYKDFYVLSEVLKDDILYSVAEVDAMLKPYLYEVIK